jgi:hypothetical protein
MLTDLSHGNKNLAAAIALGAILGCACDAAAQSSIRATSDSPAAEMRQLVTTYFNVPPDLLDGAKVLITVHVRLDKAGAVVGSPEVTAKGGSDAQRKGLSAAALRAVLRASPFTMLPKEKYESWKEVVLRFEPGDPTP